MYLSDIFTVPANIADLPSISVPDGKNSSGLPMGMEFTAGFGADETVFEIAKKFEKII